MISWRLKTNNVSNAKRCALLSIGKPPVGRDPSNPTRGESWRRVQEVGIVTVMDLGCICEARSTAESGI